MFELTIAKRHLRAMRGQRQISLTSLIAIAGVGIGVGALVIVLSVFNGFTEKLWNGLLGMHPHLTVRKIYGKQMENDGALMDVLVGQEQVVGITPFIGAEGFLFRKPPSGEPISTGTRVRGIPQAGLLQISDVEQHLWGGKVDLELQGPANRERVFGMLIGSYLADRLGVVVGSEVFLGLIPRDVLDAPRYWRYVVTGIFKTGLEAFDAGLAFVSLTALQRDLGQGDISGFQIRLQDPFRADQVAREWALLLQARDAELDVISWMGEHRSLYASIRLEKWYSFLVLSLIVVVAGFNIISILTMTVAGRRREIGVLKTLGATPKSIGRIFMLEGLAIGLSGVLIGTSLGFVLCWIQAQYEPIKLPGDVYIIQALPVSMSGSDFLVIGVASVVLCYLFARFPARAAANLDPIVAIRDG